MIYAGVDIAKMDHVIDAVDDKGNKVAKPMGFKNTEAGFERCVAWLEGVAEDPGEVFVGMESTGHYWMACFAYLMARGYKVAVINPMQVKAMRRLKSMPRVKNDRIDSWLIAEVLRMGDFDVTRLATDEVQSLKMLTRYRQQLKQEQAAVKTQLICVLDAYFPEYAGIFGGKGLFGAGSLAVLERCPTPAECGKVRASTLAKVLSKASVGITLGQDAASYQIKTMVGQIKSLEETTAEVTAKIEALLEGVEPLILTIPGVSTATGAQIVAEIGDVARFKNAAAVVSYAGLNSGVSQSGQFEAKGEPITKHGSPYLRRAMWLAADGARKKDPALKAFYEKKRGEGKCHRVAVTAVARKLCHIVYAVMRDQVPYDPDR